MRRDLKVMGEEEEGWRELREEIVLFDFMLVGTGEGRDKRRGKPEEAREKRSRRSSSSRSSNNKERHITTFYPADKIRRREGSKG